MDVTAQSKSITFPAGIASWTNFIGNGTATGINGTTGANFTLTAASQNITLQPGEYHIYVSVPCLTAPAAPTGLAVAGTTTTAATLNWTVLPGLYYWVDYRVTGSTTWLNAATAVTTGTVTLNNLTPSATYEWRVAANCSNVLVANYTSSQFTLIGHNSTIRDIKNGFGIKISPNPVSGAAIIDYVVPGNGNVFITLKNATGQNLQVLYRGSRGAGQYQMAVTNQLNKLNAGIYFLRLHQNGKGYFTKFIKR